MTACVAGRRLCAALSLALLVPASSSAKPVRLYTFNLDRSAIYTVKTDGVVQRTAPPSHAGSLVNTVATGQRIEFSASPNPDLQPPPPPTFSNLQMTSDDCLTAIWLPSSDPSVTSYLVSYGTRSVAQGQATSYEHTFPVNIGTSASVCDLPPGRYFVAVRARNYLDALSPYSSERTVDLISVAVSFPAFEAVASTDRVRLSWQVATDEHLLGFRVYRWTGDATLADVVASNLDTSAASFDDASVSPGTAYRYVVAAVREDGSEARSVAVSVRIPGLVLSLGQNLPNPFNPSTRIPFTLPASQRVTLRIFDVKGARVATLLDQAMPAGAHDVAWNGVDDRGLTVASGTYFYVLTAGTRSQSRKLVLLK